jgi:hypothetical protein
MGLELALCQESSRLRLSLEKPLFVNEMSLYIVTMVGIGNNMVISSSREWGSGSGSSSRLHIMVEVFWGVLGCWGLGRR